MNSPQADLLIRAGRLFCADTELDGRGAVAIKGDRIVASGPDVDVDASQVLEFTDAVVVPGFVDMHFHPAPRGWKYAADPDRDILPRGTTTGLSQGDAGAATWPQYRDEIVKGSRLRVRMAISPGIYGESTDESYCKAINYVDVDATVAAIESAGDEIWGISVNTSKASCGDTDPREVFKRALEMAERTARPFLFGTRFDDGVWPLADQLAVLRPGDVVTYCFRKDPGSIVRDGKVVDEVWEARARGVLFDIGHGMMSLDFDTAEAAIADGFLPDTISTDFYKRHLGADPPHDMPRTISKLIAAGVPERDAFTKATLTPARALKLEGEVGTLRPGACADVAVVRWNDDAPTLTDTSGNVRPGGAWEPVATIRAGRLVDGSS